ncbi:MAG: DUF2767 domain-containing protein [Silvania sp.]|jgi:hypothetical protein|uniref:DUF2767 domain-containing protein n=1 Tax=Silvania sp. TaxID=3016633 RepID=UPI000FAEA6DF
MVSEDNRTEISLALGEAVLEVVQKGQEVSRENLARAMKSKAERESDDERLLGYWKACHMLV